ncbi:MAG TPA: restriction endonuclease [Alphaproteobacteria bacterium]|nr:restriction endonuclease [Alphaproteobacteria bacterium]
MSSYPLYSIDIQHEGLNKYRHISGRERGVVEQKARAQLAAWEEQWETKQAAARRQADRNQRMILKEDKKQNAIKRTDEAAQSLQAMTSILTSFLDADLFVDWEKLKDRSPFQESRPKPPKALPIPPIPSEPDVKFPPLKNILDHLLPFLWKRKLNAATARKEAAEKVHQDKLAEWSVQKAGIEKANENDLTAYQVTLSEWQSRRDDYVRDQNEQHNEMDALRTCYHERNPDAVQEYADIVLAQSEYPDFCPKECAVSYVQDSGIMVVDYKLPTPDSLPTLKQVKYVASRDQFEEVHIRQSEANGNYDLVIYQICLRTIHELFKTDIIHALSAVVFNGWVTYIDPSNGNKNTACIITVQATADAFSNINLSQVEPRACFRSLKGVGSSKLYGLAAVAPLVTVNRDDPRFVPSLDVEGRLEDGTNVASIGWEEFEHLIRELFEKEFSKDGGEVKVTRASHDGGVDAIAFDPDPIRGGKIVIQAKRYTNTVDVAAVRDLYGTVMNEGATKGILVTTATFGPDAYAFAQDKPLTLLDGGNLLHLLEQHGHKAYIDLSEAKRLNPQPLARTLPKG